jgi:hypothetical protein
MSLWDAGNLYIQAARAIVKNGMKLYGLGTNNSRAFVNSTDTLFIVGDAETTPLPRAFTQAKQVKGQTMMARTCSCACCTHSFTTAHVTSWICTGKLKMA